MRIVAFMRYCPKENYNQLDSFVADFRVALKGNKGMKELPDTDA